MFLAIKVENRQLKSKTETTYSCLLAAAALTRKSKTRPGRRQADPTVSSDLIPQCNLDSRFAATAVSGDATSPDCSRAHFRRLGLTMLGDLAMPAAALAILADLHGPPATVVAGADAVGAAKAKANALLAQPNAYRKLSSSLDHLDMDLRRAGQPRGPRRAS